MMFGTKLWGCWGIYKLKGFGLVFQILNILLSTAKLLLVVVTAKLLLAVEFKKGSPLAKNESKKSRGS